MSSTFSDQVQATDYAHESALIQDAQRGNMEAFGELCVMHYPILLDALVRRTGNYAVAEDLAQETTIRVMNALPRFEDRGQGMRGYFVTTANRLFLDHVRKTRNQKTDLADPTDFHLQQTPDPTENTEQTVLEKLRWQDVVDFVHATVPNADYAAALVARLRGEDEHANAAQQSVAVGTIRTRLFRAKQRMQAILQEHEDPHSHNR